jgi:signal peptidase I
MQNTLAPGDRLFAVPGGSVRRGDVIIFREPTRVSKTHALVVKRVIGLPGDRVACCDSRGRITVDGRALDETYLYPGDPPSRIRFSATVGKGQVWVMGDHRNISVDSREWGAIPASGVVGRVVFVAHGSSIAALRTPQTFVTDGLAPRDTRLDFYLRLALLAAASAAALLVLAIVGIARFVIRRRRRSGPAGVTRGPVTGATRADVGGLPWSAGPSRRHYAAWLARWPVGARRYADRPRVARLRLGPHPPAAPKPPGDCLRGFEIPAS